MDGLEWADGLESVDGATGDRQRSTDAYAQLLLGLLLAGRPRRRRPEVYAAFAAEPREDPAAHGPSPPP
ncbi:MULTISPECIES: hypothetical protein [Streptomyces]|uniref:hypothetical protein n=1 Tax=Streptomyces TaxID=1883 RepID=UPI000D50AC2C|nr:MULTISPECIES: hypothetical protein [Streptomyces]NYS20420.1 hypothetical protein [Streptomyces sp. SJ1-7]PVC64311.1 hypothetical protein DBP15_23890 [Streptomyces sp. CS065A]